MNGVSAHSVLTGRLRMPHFGFNQKVVVFVVQAVHFAKKHGRLKGLCRSINSGIFDLRVPQLQGFVFAEFFLQERCVNSAKLIQGS